MKFEALCVCRKNCILMSPFGHQQGPCILGRGVTSFFPLWLYCQNCCVIYALQKVICCVNTNCTRANIHLSMLWGNGYLAANFLRCACFSPRVSALLISHIATRFYHVWLRELFLYTQFKIRSSTFAKAVKPLMLWACLRWLGSLWWFNECNHLQFKTGTSSSGNSSRYMFGSDMCDEIFMLNRIQRETSCVFCDFSQINCENHLIIQYFRI